MQRLRTMFERSRDVALRHPQAFLLVPTRRFRTKGALELYERFLQNFRDAGFEPEAAARYFRLLAAFTTGFCLAEIGSRAQQPNATPIILETFADPVHFPRVTEVVPHLRVPQLKAIFDFGLDLIFERMRSELGPGGGS